VYFVYRPLNVGTKSATKLWIFGKPRFVDCLYEAFEEPITQFIVCPRRSVDADHRKVPTTGRGLAGGPPRTSDQ
jgi:hypothetical protein